MSNNFRFRDAYPNYADESMLPLHTHQVLGGTDRMISLLDGLAAPRIWKRIHPQTAKELYESDKPLIVKYVGEWKTPNGGYGIDIGFCFVAADELRTDRTWDVRASGLTRELFGGDKATYEFYCDVNEAFPNYWQRIDQLADEEDTRWAARQAQGYVKLNVQCDVGGSEGWRTITVDGERWGQVRYADRYGFPLATYFDPLGVTREILKTDLQELYERAVASTPGTWSRGALLSLAKEFPSSEIFPVWAAAYPDMDETEWKLFHEGNSWSDITVKTQKYQSWSTGRLTSWRYDPLPFEIPEWHTGPVPVLFGKMQQALTAWEHCRTIGWQKAAEEAGVEPSSIGVLPRQYEEIAVFFGYPFVGFHEALDKQIESIVEYEATIGEQLRAHHKAHMDAIEIVLEAANAAVRGQKGSLATLRQALRDSGLYRPTQA